MSQIMEIEKIKPWTWCLGL